MAGDSDNCGKYSNKVIKNREQDMFIIYYKSTCPYSRNALSLLQQKKVEFKGYDVGKRIDGKEKAISCFLSNKELQFPDTFSTVPMIFYKGKFIGGFDKLNEYFSSSS